MSSDDHRYDDWDCNQVKGLLQVLLKIGQCDYCGKKFNDIATINGKEADPRGGCLILLCDEHRHLGEPYLTSTYWCFH